MLFLPLHVAERVVSGKRQVKVNMPYAYEYTGTDRQDVKLLMKRKTSLHTDTIHRGGKEWPNRNEDVFVQCMLYIIDSIREKETDHTFQSLIQSN